MNGLSCGEESMTIYSAVLIQYQHVTDGQTDRQTDVQPISITCFSIADARKNCCHENSINVYTVKLHIPLSAVLKCEQRIEKSEM